MNSGLARRIAFTLGALVVYRLGTYIPLPGIDPEQWRYAFQGYGGQMFGAFAELNGGGASRLAVLSLGVLPYVTAAVFMQIAIFFVPALKAIAKRGDAGRSTIARYTLILTIVLAAFHGLGIAFALEHVGTLVADPGWPFRIVTALSLTAGTLFLVWLASQITRRGFGNGLALILFAQVVVAISGAGASFALLEQQGAIAPGFTLRFAVSTLILTLVIIVIENARCNLTVVSGKGGRAVLPIKINSAGVVPALVASWAIAFIPLAVGRVVGWQSPSAKWLITHFDHGDPVFIVVYGLAVFGAVFLYTAFVLDPDEAAETLKSTGTAIEGVAPGEVTAARLDDALSRTTLVGAVYLTAICLIPEILIASTGLPFYFAGTSLLVLVCTIMDLVKQGRAMGRSGGLRRDEAHIAGTAGGGEGHPGTAAG